MTADDLPRTPAGVVTNRDVDLRDEATATVIAERPAMVMLKASFDPRWQVTIDGIPVEPEMIAPSFVGRMVPAGEHVVRFVYEPFRATTSCCCSRRRRRRPRRAPEGGGVAVGQVETRAPTVRLLEVVRASPRDQGPVVDLSAAIAGDLVGEPDGWVPLGSAADSDCERT